MNARLSFEPALRSGLRSGTRASIGVEWTTLSDVLDEKNDDEHDFLHVVHLGGRWRSARMQVGALRVDLTNDITGLSLDAAWLAR